MAEKRNAMIQVYSSTDHLLVRRRTCIVFNVILRRNNADYLIYTHYLL